MTLLPFDMLDPYAYTDDTVPWVGAAALAVGTAAVVAGVLVTAAACWVVDTLVRKARR